jgi:hypothetical protein
MRSDLFPEQEAALGRCLRERQIDVKSKQEDLGEVI